MFKIGIVEILCFWERSNNIDMIFINDFGVVVKIKEGFVVVEVEVYVEIC